MFIPTKSDRQVSVNLRNNKGKKKFKKKTFVSANYPFAIHSLPFVGFVSFFFFFKWDPHDPFSSFLGPFQPRNNLFCLGFNFIYPN